MIVPFINFAGQATEAIALYEIVFNVQDKKVFLFKDMPAEMKPNFPPETDHYVMHSEMTINGTPVWIGDTIQGITTGDMVSLSVPMSSQEEIRAAFDKLKVGGKVLMELVPTFYSPLFGTVQDKFGVIWHFICQE
ncbi:MAG: VOC family protein [Tannerellaceae bacterium]|jgi:PhnB protein|nr:VOC family protein [Tannerellaceae bacterium]